MENLLLVKIILVSSPTFSETCDIIVIPAIHITAPKQADTRERPTEAVGVK